MTQSASILSRRRALGFVSASTILGVLVSLAGCGRHAEAVACNDPDKLSDDQIALRQTLQYTEHSPDPARVCERCTYFTVAEPGKSCGTCNLMRGPVNPGGHCSSWSARKA